MWASSGSSHSSWSPWSGGGSGIRRLLGLRSRTASGIGGTSRDLSSHCLSHGQVSRAAGQFGKLLRYKVGPLAQAG